MKALVTGGKGLLGKEVCKELQAADWDVLSPEAEDANISEIDGLQRLARDFRPEAIVNCAAWTDVDGCEYDPARAFLVNAMGARNLAVVARRCGAKLLHVSTDYVFSGDEGRAYTEFDPVGPRSVYGKSKEAGERLVREQAPEHFIVRTAWLYGDDERCFPRVIERRARELLLQGKPLRVVDDQRGTPTWSRELARQITCVLSTEAFGTYHATALGETTWYHFARMILESLAIPEEVEPCTSAEFPRAARRPRNSVLDNFCLRIQRLDVMKPWEEAWEEFLEVEDG